MKVVCLWKLWLKGPRYLRFGPKPVGLTDPYRKRTYAVVQLRQDTIKQPYTICWLSTNLKFSEQRRVFSLIPGLENAEFIRYGVMHRNTFINSPKLLDSFYRMRENNRIYFAGQITGVEGYVESASSGLVAGYHLAGTLLGKQVVEFPGTTAIGALARYISNPTIRDFQPMNVNFGIMDPGKKSSQQTKMKQAHSDRA